MAITRKTRPWDGVLAAGRKPAGEQLAAETFVSSRKPRFATMPVSLHAELREALAAGGTERLYVHQAEAFELAASSHLMVTTGTASGKSLCFNLPVLDAILGDPKRRALYIYPTKALAQDQARALGALGLPVLRHAIYDGDTPRGDRGAIRKSANLVLTNPDMLHVGILPHHDSWGDFLTNLRYVVVDEAHVYRGVFGSHVANVLRRLRRLARVYGAVPRFVLTSATIANPLALAETLVGTDFKLVDDDGAPQAERHVVMWNPPLVEKRIGARKSSLSEASELLADLVASGARTICFARSRRAAELIYRFAHDRLARRDSAAARRIAPYRAGYTPQQRREIEARLAGGELLGVVATSALELGIDIGMLDAAISVTFPGTVASLRQQWGRAGRSRRGLAVFVAGDDALDQFFCRHPDEFFDRPVEAAILDPENDYIHPRHLVTAAYEAPLTAADEEILGPRMRAYAERLVDEGQLRHHKGRYLPRRADFPASRISLRSASADAFAIVERSSGELIGTVEAERAFDTVHPGAIYLHLGEPYEVADLRIDERRVIVTRSNASYYTQPKKDVSIHVEEILDGQKVVGVELSFGRVSVTEQVLAYQRKRLDDHSVLDLVALDLPAQNFPTQALWYVLPEDLVGDLPLDAMLGSLHATEHAQIAVLPLIAMCDRWDIGGLSTNVHPQTLKPTIFIYDGHPGGVGIARHGFGKFELLVSDAERLVEECPCEAGCPSCVQSPKCGNLNEPLHKLGALELMNRMLKTTNMQALANRRRPVPGGTGRVP